MIARFCEKNKLTIFIFSMSFPCIIMPVAIGKSSEGYGEKFNAIIGQSSAKGNGWAHVLSFKAFQFPQPHTFPVTNRRIIIGRTRLSSFSNSYSSLITKKWVSISASVSDSYWKLRLQIKISYESVLDHSNSMETLVDRVNYTMRVRELEPEHIKFISRFSILMNEA